MIRQFYHSLIGLGLITAGSAAVFLAIFLQPPVGPIEWCQRIIIFAWGVIMTALGFDVLTIAGDPVKDDAEKEKRQ